MTDDTTTIGEGESSVTSVNLEPGQTLTLGPNNAALRLKLTFEEGSVLETILPANTELFFTRGTMTPPKVDLTVPQGALHGPRSVDHD